MYTVLLTLQRHLSLGDFFRLIEEGGPKLAVAANLLQVYAREQNRELLKDFYFQDDRRVDSACLALEDAAEAKVSGRPVDHCRNCIPDTHVHELQDPESKLEHVRDAAKFFAEDKERRFEAKVQSPRR